MKLRFLLIALIDNIHARSLNIEGGLRYTLRMFLLAGLPAFCLVIIIGVVSEALGLDFRPKRDILTLRFMALAIFAAPPIETAMMIPILAIIRRFIRSPVVVAAISGALWSTQHLSVGPIGLLTAWPFFIFSLMWEAKRHMSRWDAYIHVVLCHTLYNSCIILITALARMGERWTA